MDQQRHSALVCGASIAGLLAAGVLADFFDTVTVVERDTLPDNAVQRRGVAQGRHLHMMLTAGLPHLESLFPGLVDELADAGAHVLDARDPSILHMRAAGNEMSVDGSFATPEEPTLLLASRPLLEDRIRRRVLSLDNVSVIDGHDVVDFEISDGRVTGARVAERSTGAERRLSSDWLVDATGRSNRLPTFLAAQGYPTPRKRAYPVGLSYSSQFFRMPKGALHEKAVVAARPLERFTGAGLLAYEDDMVILTLIGLAGHRPPTDVPGLLDAVTEILPARMTTALRSAEPLGPVSAHHYPASTWRRYDELDRFPDGLLVMGDAVCSFNPVWGQGMTSAALQATALHRCLSDGGADLRTRYFREAAKRLSPIWRSNRVVDFVVIPADGWRAVAKRAVNVLMNVLWRAAARDIRITETWIRTIELLDPPTVWLRPLTLRRVLVGGLRPP